MPRLDDSVAYAANWKAVLAADAGAGLGVVLVGVAVLVLVHVVMGGLIAALGATYLVLVGRRARSWAALRRDAGL